MKKNIFMKSILFFFVVFLYGCGAGMEDDGPGAFNEKAKVVALPYSVEDNINIDSKNTEDVYYILLKSGVYAISMELLDGSLGPKYNLRMSIADSRGNSIVNLNSDKLDEVGEIKQFTFRLKKDDVYTIKIFRNGNYETFYKFTLYPSNENGLVHDDTYEYNNFIEMAAPIKFEQITSLSIETELNLKKEDVTDYFDVNISKKGFYALKVRLLDGTEAEKYNLGFAIYNPDIEEVVAFNNDKLDEVGEYVIVPFTVENTGNYYFYFLRNGTGNETVYSFQLYPTIQNGLIQDDNYEFNDLKEMATPISIDEFNNGIESDVNVLDEDSIDWYEVTLEAGTYDVTYELLSGSVSNNYNLRVLILDPENTEIVDINSDNVDNEGESDTFSFTASQSGLYKIALYRNNNSLAYYKITISKQ